MILCSHGTAALGDALPATVDALAKVVREDDNVFCVGSALDALARLADFGPHSGRTPNRGELCTLVDALVRDMPIHSWEPLVRSGLTRHMIATCQAAETDIARP